MSVPSIITGITAIAALGVAIVGALMSSRRAGGASQRIRRWRLILAGGVAVAAAVAGIAGLIAGSVWWPVWSALMLVTAGLNIRDALSVKMKCVKEQATTTPARRNADAP